ncbi:penicillin-binding protein 2 [Ornithinimicrobium sp. F0845]|uniref:peptidoglycan D,D-transpeptidase FtsI family protein n=1 Tax=Ornithinimicrobium sp. F0845 TaxID=2926412 RepID=UPI001FF3CE41|nr:penicillin-binding protein 2 [Ornithinimicrobium sp. F0845]MCK0112663.1 penicillin-binding protein 2 [Ornithinimicrobium sp. F0845]
MATRRPKAPKGLRGVVHPQRRMRIMLFGILVVFSLFAAQLVKLQGLDAASVSAAAVDRRLHEVTIPASRGTIYDANGVVLAESIERRHITADPTAVKTYTKRIDGEKVEVGYAGAAAEIAAVTGGDAARMEQTLRDRDGARWTYLQKDVSPQTWQEVHALGIPGIYSEPFVKRSYPLGSAMAPLVGWVGSSGLPANGIELMFDERLNGTPGSTTYELGGRGEIITTGTSSEIPAVPGEDVHLTIDSDLQWTAYNAVANEVRRNGSLTGSAMVLDADTCEILAAATYPAFDPSDAQQTSEGLRNPLFEDVYEPGSTSKVITAAAALEEDIVDVETPFVVPNRIYRGGSSFKDSHDPDTPYLTFAGILATSSNMGTIMYGEELPDEVFYQYMRDFGMGNPASLGFPGQSAGSVPAVEDWSATSKYTLYFGQGLASTMIQQIGVFQTVASGGVHCDPKVIKGTTEEGGRYVAEADSEGDRVISEETAAELTSIMEYVPSEEGTARKAAVEGYRVAGKTSTADRYDPTKRRYSGVTSGFIGFAPADDPDLVVAVVMQRPTRGKWGGELAGPVFSEIMRYGLTSRGVEPSTTEAPQVKLEYDPNAPAPRDVSPGATLGDIAIRDEGNA